MRIFFLYFGATNNPDLPPNPISNIVHKISHVVLFIQHIHCVLFTGYETPHGASNLTYIYRKYKTSNDVEKACLNTLLTDGAVLVFYRLVLWT